VTPRRAIRDPAVVVWLGVLGPPVAWTVQHVTGYALTQAHCSVAGRGGSRPGGGLTAAVTAAAAAVVVLGWLASLAVLRATRDGGSDPPASRIRFLAIIGLSTAPLFLLIILMSGTGSVALGGCHQG
jgi:multisubunit Na+/H+ antiporter MnhB subunit